MSADELITWLRGVLDEDEARYRPLVEDWQHPEVWDGGDAVDDLHHWRWQLADIAAKRAILDEYDGGDPPTDKPRPAYGLWRAAKHLAMAYADRPGYRDKWRP